jgi:ribokinase
LATLETPLEVSVEPMRVVSDRSSLKGDGAMVLNVAPSTALPSDFGGSWDWIVANEIEVGALLGRSVCDEASALAAAHDVASRWGSAIVTLGPRGAVATTMRSHVAADAYDVDVVDTTGAGDAFCAAFGVRIAEGATLDDAVRFACAAGAIACTKEGAEPSMPYRADVEALYEWGVMRR